MRWLSLLALALACASCASKIEGETNTLPPAGGPKVSADRPPGENPDLSGGGKR